MRRKSLLTILVISAILVSGFRTDAILSAYAAGSVSEDAADGEAEDPEDPDDEETPEADSISEDETVSGPAAPDDDLSSVSTDRTVSSNVTVRSNVTVSGDGTASVNDTVSADMVSGNTITRIDPPAKNEVTLEFKPTLDSLYEEMPSNLTVYHGESAENIHIAWICRDDYDETLGDYIFVPDLSGFTVPQDLEVPSFTVHIENERVNLTGGYLEEDLAYDIPETTSRKGLLKSSSSSSYNSYKRGVLPVIRNQRPYGSCWTFAAIGAMEADLIHDGRTGTGVDLSEIHLAYYTSHNYTDPKGCRRDSVTYSPTSWTGGIWLDNGGNVTWAYRTLANHIGAVRESDARYSAGNSYNPGPGNAFSMDYVQLKNAYVISPSDTNAIKSAIQAHGGVATAYYDDNSAYTASTASYYYGGYGSTNHAVMLVGWDDRYSRNNFKSSSRPSGDGAWLVRNSWGGNGYCHEGYFWLSYYDRGFASTPCVVAIDADFDQYDNCYAYDGDPVDDLVYSATSSTPVSQTYRVKGGETLKAVSFEIGTANVRADITVKDLNTGSSVTKSIKTTYAGLYTADISGLDFPSDTTVEISIRYTPDSGRSVYVLCERNGVGSSYGDIYYTGVCDGGFNMAGYRYNCDARMKLFTNNKNSGKIPVTSVTLNKTSLELKNGQGFQLAATALPSNATDRSISWSSSDPSVATVTSGGYVTALRTGKTVITARNAASGRSAACSVTVSSSDNIDAFVTRLYRTALEREPDAEGFAYWTGQLRSGNMNGADVVCAFYLSDEMMRKRLSNSQYVETAYKGIMDRASDPEGKAYWTGALDGGTSYRFVISGFTCSPEFANLCGNYGIIQGSLSVTENRDKNLGATQYVNRLYTYVLGRRYDVDGLNYWCGRILADKRRSNVRDVATTGFFHSDEFIRRNLNNGEFVKVLYRAFLDREYDKPGYDYWKWQLDSGKMSRDEVINDFAYSEEFSSLMAKYGL